MEPSFTSLNLDPLIATQVIGLLGMKEYEISNPHKYQQLRSIVTYFQTKDNPRFEILKVLSKNPGMDNLTAVWTYVELQTEKQNKLQKLQPDDFQPDIEEQLRKGFMTRDSIKKVQSDLAKRKRELAKQKQRETQEQNKIDKVVGKVFDETKLAEIQDTIYDIENINKQLDFYG